ncbi:PREDICTED: uncharacterized protein LOC105363308 [Ceratosolen solmsi marchali]|uniref:Uncharacterized protein LOC105363308 n=1 Tax=Ceratosolen solmsi marchali TaxID=326594 RepID=A0AAJ6YJL9_9HYME|nr:PREDICTED: uncharacterized protein LOC105363308 [Ceratosolen solmsi marchali]
MKRNTKPVVRFKIYPKTHYIGRCTELPAPIITSTGRYNDRHRKHTAFAENDRYKRRSTTSGVKQRCYRGRASRTESGTSGSEETYESAPAEVAKALAAFRKCDEFLQRHRIRPEFFCRYRERLALQAWLLQRVTAKASRNVFDSKGK